MILDTCCGSMKMYRGWDRKLADSLISIDIRKGDFSFALPEYYDRWSKTIDVQIYPTVQADMKYLPFRNERFEGIVFDPPFIEFGLTEFIFSVAYGKGWTQKETIRTLRIVNEEFNRVLKPGGFLFMKLNRERFPLFETLLTNFVFFLPIEFRTGAYQGKKSAKRKLWSIGQKNVT